MQSGKAQKNKKKQKTHLLRRAALHIMITTAAVAAASAPVATLPEVNLWRWWGLPLLTSSRTNQYLRASRYCLVRKEGENNTTQLANSERRAAER